MKREEMLHKIENMVSNYRYTIGNTPSSEIAESLLSLIEKAGMKPPCVSEENCQVIMHIYMGGNFHQWDEDLLKDVKVQTELQRRAEWNAKSPEEQKAIRQARREARSKRLWS